MQCTSVLSCVKVDEDLLRPPNTNRCFHFMWLTQSEAAEQSYAGNSYEVTKTCAGALWVWKGLKALCSKVE